MIRAREAVLRDHLHTLRYLIDRFTLDNDRAPLSLDEIVEKGLPQILPWGHGLRDALPEQSRLVVALHRFE